MPQIVPVSAVVPCYRCATTIRRAVLSVAEQTRRPAEIILVNDGSDDGTRIALRNLQTELGTDWIRVIGLPSNRGAAAARNLGWELARGSCVAFLDADDSWSIDKIEQQHAFMERHPEFAISGHLARYVDERGTPRRKSDSAEFREISRASVLLRNPMVTPSLMVRRNVELRFNAQIRYMEDQRFLQDAVFSGLRVARMERVLATIHKAAFGQGGLSGQLWAMEQGELENYRALRRTGQLRTMAYGFFAAYSLAKFCRRVLVARFVRPPSR
jgi:glycosyltransferase involved in cell wall biosynthesis